MVAFFIKISYSIIAVHYILYVKNFYIQIMAWR